MDRHRIIADLKGLKLYFKHASQDIEETQTLDTLVTESVEETIEFCEWAQERLDRAIKCLSD